MKKLLQFQFVPTSADLGLLVLRLWFGLSMIWLHGWPKLAGFSSMAGGFPDPLGVGSKVSLSLAIFGELVCSALVVLGLFTRFAALLTGITMAVAFWRIHGLVLSGPQSGELAYAFLGAFLVIFLAGPGRFSVDARSGGTGKSR